MEGVSDSSYATLNTNPNPNPRTVFELETPDFLSYAIVTGSTIRIQCAGAGGRRPVRILYFCIFVLYFCIFLYFCTVGLHIADCKALADCSP